VTGTIPQTAFKAITVVLEKDGTATEIAKLLKKEHGLLTGNIQNARGTGEPSNKRSFMNHVEKDLFTVVVPEDQADEIFSLLYHECRMGSRMGGFMYQAHLSQLSEFTLPDLDNE
jgi:hypothetical protein